MFKKILAPFVLTSLIMLPLLGVFSCGNMKAKQMFEQYWSQNDKKIRDSLCTQIINDYPGTEYGLFCKAIKDTSPSSSIIMLTQAIEKNNKFWQAYYKRGEKKMFYNTHIEFKDETAKDVINDFTKAIEIFPDYYMIYYDMVIVYAVKKDCENAIKAGKKAIELDSSCKSSVEINLRDCK